MTISLGSSDVLFVGLGTSALGWYRSALPALNLGCDWIGVRGEDPHHLHFHSALTRNGLAQPNFEDYKIVVLQQVSGFKWRKRIAELQAQGIKVFYEIDDYLPSIRKTSGHLAQKKYTRKVCDAHFLCMMAADALIVTNIFLADRYQRYNDLIFVCPNGVEVERYSHLKAPIRTTTNIGWAGGTGHGQAVRPWLPAVENVMKQNEEVVFATIGEPYARELDDSLNDRCLAIPFSTVENFPGTMTNIDIALAPAGRSDFYKGKSDLRWLEASAMRIPLVFDPFVYTEARDGETGLAAVTCEEAHRAILKLLHKPDLRRKIADQAHEYVSRYRDIRKMVDYWERAFVSIWA